MKNLIVACLDFYRSCLPRNMDLSLPSHTALFSSLLPHLQLWATVFKNETTQWDCETADKHFENSLSIVTTSVRPHSRAGGSQKQHQMARYLTALCALFNYNFFKKINDILLLRYVHFLYWWSHKVPTKQFWDSLNIIRIILRGYFWLSVVTDTMKIIHNNCL